MITKKQIELVRNDLVLAHTDCVCDLADVAPVVAAMLAERRALRAACRALYNVSARRDAVIYDSVFENAESALGLGEDED